MQVRIEGNIEIVNDNELKDEIIKHPSRKFLTSWKGSLSTEEFYNTFIVLKIISGKATIWTMERNFLDKEYIELFD